MTDQLPSPLRSTRPGIGEPVVVRHEPPPEHEPDRQPRWSAKQTLFGHVSPEIPLLTARRTGPAGGTAIGHAPPDVRMELAIAPRRHEPEDHDHVFTAQRVGDAPIRPVPVLAQVVRPDQLDPALTVHHAPRGAAAEAYRSMFYHIGATSSARRIMVTSSAAGDDGAVCAANLALATAERSDDRVLLVEAHFARPRLAELFGFVPLECFGERLARHRRCRGDDVWRLAHLEDTNLRLLALDPTQSIVQALDTQALAELTEGLVACGFGHVIIAGPPTTPTTDARYVARAADGVVMAVFAKQSRSRDIRAAARMLPCPLLGYAFFGA